MASKTAVVTGSAQGLGNGIAKRLAEDGYNVALFDMKDATQAAQEISEEYGVTATALEVNVADERSVQDAFNQLKDSNVQAIVNAAGIFLDKPVWETSVDAWDKVMAVNSRGPFLVSKHGGQQIAANGGGSIVNILSNASVQGFAHESAYCASKGAALLLTRTLAVEYAKYNITVNGVGPGTSETAMGGDYLSGGPIADHELSRTPLGRWGQAPDIAEAVAFFITAATWTTGQALYVDGGFLATGLPDFERLK